MVYRNIGTATQPRLAPGQPILVEWAGATPKPSWVWWTPEDKTLVTQWRTTPKVIDWNKDGLPDLVMLDAEGYLCLFERRLALRRRGRHERQREPRGLDAKRCLARRVDGEARERAARVHRHLPLAKALSQLKGPERCEQRRVLGVQRRVVGA